MIKERHLHHAVEEEENADRIGNVFSLLVKPFNADMAPNVEHPAGNPSWQTSSDFPFGIPYNAYITK